MLLIRPEKPEDAAGVRLVNHQAFGQPEEARLVDWLRANGKVTLALVAEQRQQIVGYILFSPVTIDPGGEKLPAAGLAPMAVLPDFQRQGIGSRLVQTGLAEGRKLGLRWVVVLGHPAYYPRFGFGPASRYGLRCEYDVPDDVFMALELQPGALQGLSGTVKYQPEFKAL